MQDGESRVRDFLAKTAAGDWDGAVALFDEAMRAALPAQKLAELWRSIEQSAGAFKKIDSVAMSPHDAYRVGLATASFERAPLLLRVVLGTDGRVTGFFVAPGDMAAGWQPPSYAKMDSFVERDVTIGTPALPGTLSVPKSGAPFAAVVPVHGSGPNDRDETLGALKVFKDLAYGLASRGVAVLRYDKRTRVDATGVRTQKEEVEDAAHAAVAFLRTRLEIDPSRIVLLGHSQGGNLAPRIAKSDSAIKGLVILAGSTRPLEDSLLGQLQYLAKLEPGAPGLSEAIALAREFKTTVESPTLTAEQSVRVPLSSPVPGAYFLDVRGYHAEKVAGTLAIPILVLQGERDYQVTLADDFPAWKGALAHKTNATLKTYPALNHAFATGEGPPSPGDYTKPGHVDEAVIADIADFATKLP